MNRLLYTVVLLCLAQLPLYAQHQVRVLDLQTQEPIVAADVYFPDAKTGTITDSNGIFKTTVGKGSVLVQVSSASYKTFLGTVSLQDEQATIFLEPSVHNLQEITVSASSSKLQNSNVSSVENVRLNNNPLAQGISLTQKLSGVAGVDNFSTGAGIGKPVIRGLSGNRIAVFSQGIRIENQQWGDEHGLGLDENGYEQVEVIKGPSSLLYGSDALGGVLYFVGERYALDNSLEATLGSEYNTNTEGWRNTGSFKLSKGKFHWNTFGGYTTHKDYKDGDGSLVNNSRFHTTDFKTGFGYTGSKFISSLKYSYLREVYGLTEEPEDSAATYANGRTPEIPYQDLATHIASSENTLFFNNGSKLKLDLGYVFNSRKEFGEQAAGEAPQAELSMNLSTLSYNARWTSAAEKNPWTWIAGSQGMYQTNTNKGPEVLIPNATTADLGLYVSTDYHYTKKSYWQVGARVDGRQIDGEENGVEGEDGYIPALSKTYTAFNFSTGVLQQLSSAFSLRAFLSSGFRAPTMFELLSDGVHEGTNRYEVGNQNLKTENSYQLDVSLNYAAEHLTFFVNPYLSYIRNYIFLQTSGDIKDNMPVYNYTQTNAYLTGGEAGFHFHPHPLDWLHLQASYGSTYGMDSDRNNLPLMPSSKINSVISANFSGNKAIRKFSVFMQYQYSFKQNRVAEFETPTPDYSLVSAGVHTEFSIGKLRLLADVTANNLFDKRYYDHLSRYKSEGINNMGRNVVLKLAIPLSMKL